MSVTRIKCAEPVRKGIMTVLVSMDDFEGIRILFFQVHFPNQKCNSLFKFVFLKSVVLYDKDAWFYPTRRQFYFFFISMLNTKSQPPKNL